MYDFACYLNLHFREKNYILYPDLFGCPEVHTTPEKLVELIIDNEINALNLGRSYFSSPDEANEFFNLLAKAEHKLIELKTDHNCEFILTQENAVCLAKVLRSSNTLEYLNMMSPSIDDAMLSVLCTAIKENPNSAIKSLQFSFTKITDGGIQYLLPLIEENGLELMTLDLQGAKITEQGVVMLARALQINTKLRGLNVAHLAQNSAVKKGINAMAEMLEKNQTLKILGLLDVWKKMNYLILTLLSD